MKQGIYIVVSATEIVKIERKKPEREDYGTGVDVDVDDYAMDLYSWRDYHSRFLTRIPIQGKHNWKVWQEVEEGKDFRFGLSNYTAFNLETGHEEGRPTVAIPIEQTKSEGAKSELLSVNEAGAIAAKIAETVSPALSAHEQALFVAGFQECIKYLSQQNNLLANDNSQTP